MADTPPIQPALSAEEWAKLVPGEALWLGGAAQFPYIRTHDDGSITVDTVTDYDGVTSPLKGHERHGVAALCLYGQPFGFTGEDVALIRGLWGALEADGHPVAYEDSNAAKLAARIEALLPPPPSSKRD